MYEIMHEAELIINKEKEHNISWMQKKLMQAQVCCVHILSIYNVSHALSIQMFIKVLTDA